MKRPVTICIGLLLLGILLTTPPAITGYAVKSMGGAAAFFGLLMILTSVLLFIGAKDLERIIGDHDRNIDSMPPEKRELFLAHHTKPYLALLEESNLIPAKYDKRNKRLRFARDILDKHPALAVTKFDKDNSLEYIEHYRHSPKGLKAKVNWKVDDDPILKKYTEKYSWDDLVWNAARRKVYELALNGELGTLNKSYKYIPGADAKYVYLRDVGSGARVILKMNSPSDYDLICIISGRQKKADEDRVFDRIRSYS